MDHPNNFAAALEKNPALGWLVAVMNWLIAVFAWLVQHADNIAKMLACGAAMFGFIAGYYTMRIQRRAFLRDGAAPDQSRTKKRWYRR